MIVIVDYGMGNLGSVKKAFERLGSKTYITSQVDIIEKANKLILPGIGHFGAGMENLRKKNLLKILNKKVLKDKTPVLGICLGMQLFTDYGEEGDTEGLGWIKGKTILFRFKEKNNNIRIPHMGWNTLNIKKKSTLLTNFSNDARYYFVHSYYVDCADKEDILTDSEYGIKFTSMVARENIYGAQFHPEKSHSYGLDLLKNFIDII